MKNKIILLIIFCLWSLGLTAQIITSVAGNGINGYTGNGGQATAAKLDSLYGIAIDRNKNLYIADSRDNVIRKVDRYGVITTFAGTGTSGYSGDGGQATAAKINHQWGVAVDLSGNVFISDHANNVIRKVNTSGIISTIAGTGTGGFSGDGGQATAAQLWTPTGIATDAVGNVYISDYGWGKIRKINSSTGIITTIAGSGVVGFSGDGGAATAAKLYAPFGLTVDASGNIYIADRGNERIRKVNASGIITTVAGTGVYGYNGDGIAATAAKLYAPYDVVTDNSGNIYIADANNQRIRRINSSGIISTIGGTGIGGYNGDGHLSTITQTTDVVGLAIDSCQNVYFSDYNYPRVRKINFQLSPINGSSYICGGATTTMIDATSGGVWSSSNNSIATVNSSGAVTGVSGGTAIISYSLYDSCGLSYATHDITVNTTGPSADTIIGTATVCIYASVTLSVVSGSLGGVWTSSDTSIASVNSSTGVVTGTPFIGGTATITYTGCGAAVATYGVTVIPFADPGTIVGPSAVCLGSAISLTNAVGSGVWSSIDPAIATINSSGIVTGLTTGSATIWFERFNSCGSTVAYAYVNVDHYPIPGSIEDGTTFCASNVITLANSTGDAGVWSTSNPLVATIDEYGNLSGVSSGNVTITYTVDNACGLEIATTNINVEDVAGSILGSGTLCVGSSLSLTNIINGGVWSSDNTSIATVSASTGVVTGVGLGSTIVSYSVTNTCGNSSSSIPAIVLGVPTTISGTTYTGVGYTTTLSNTTTGGTWSSSSPSIATVSASGMVTGNAVGTATISYSTGCGSPATVLLTVLGGPDVILGNSSLCVGTTTILTNATTGGSWISGNLAVASINSSGLVTGVSSGTSIITYTTGFGTDAHFTITVNSLPTISGNSVSICNGSSGTLTASGGVTYTWSPGASLSSTTGASVVASPTVTTNYTITGTNANGCVNRSYPVVTVNNVPSLPAITGIATVCAGGITTLSNTVAYPPGTWSSNNTSIASVTGYVGPGIGDPSNGIVNGMSAGTTTITYSATNSCGTNYVTQSITVNSLPTISGSSISICNGSSATLTASGGVTYTWSPGTGLSATTGASPLASPTTTAVYTITGTDANGCVNTGVSTVTVNDVPVVGAISGATSVCAGANTTLTNATAGGSWSSTNTSVATISASGMVHGITGGTTIISYGVTNSCGTTYVTKVVTVQTAPGTITGTSPLCVGSTFTFTNPVAGGSWSSSATSRATVDAITGAVTAVATGPTVTITYSTGCGSNATISLTITTVPSAPAPITGLSTVCAGASITLSDATAGGTWSSGNLMRATVNGTGVVTGVAAGTVGISYGVTNACGTTSVGKTITVTDVPVVTPISGGTSVCQGANLTLSVSPTTGGTWSGGTTAVATVNSSGVVRGVSGGSVIISYTKTNTCGSTTVTLSVTVNPLPSVDTISATAYSFCQVPGIVDTFSCATPGGVWSTTFGPYFYTINSATGVLTLVNTVLSPVSVIVLYAVTNSCGTTTVRDTVLAKGRATITVPPAICSGGGTTSVTGSPSGGLWSGTGYNTSYSATDVNPNTLTANTTNGAFVIYYTLPPTNASYCSSQPGAINLYIINPANIFITGPGAVNAGSSISLTTTNGIVGTWTSSSPSNATVSTTVEAIKTVNGVSVGMAIISFTGGATCPTGSDTQLVNVNLGPKASGQGTFEEDEDHLSVYPNPNHGSFTIALPISTTSSAISVTDISGRIIATRISAKQQEDFDLSQFPRGFYIISVTADDKKYKKKVLIE